MPNYKGKRPGTRRIVIWLKGKPHEKTITATKAEGDKFEARWRLELEAAPSSPESTSAPVSVPKFSELSKAYSEAAARELKASSWYNRRYQLATLVELLGEEPVDTIGPAHIERVKELLLTHMQPSSVNAYLMGLSAVLSWGRRLRYPIAKFEVTQLPTRKADRVETFTRAELEEMFRWSRRCYPGLFRMLLFLVNTGCRKGEAIAARWDWVDAPNRILTIPATKYWQPKSGRSRDIPIPDALLPILTGPHEHPEAIFPSMRGWPYTAFPLWQFREMLKATGVKGHPHMFRHTFASEFLAATNGDMHLLAQVMGHSHTRVTALYAHMIPGRLEKARNAVNIGAPVRDVEKLKKRA